MSIWHRQTTAIYHEDAEIILPDPESLTKGYKSIERLTFEPTGSIERIKNPKQSLTIPTMFLPATPEEIEQVIGKILPVLEDQFNGQHAARGVLNPISKVNNTSDRVKVLCYHFPNKFMFLAGKELNRQPIRLIGDYLAHLADASLYIAPTFMDQTVSKVFVGVDLATRYLPRLFSKVPR
jgi:hypothetical protein